MYTIRVNEVQALLSQLLQPGGTPKVVQVTYRVRPVVALVPKQYYTDVLSSLLSDSEEGHLSLTTDTITSHQAGRVFNAFKNQLSPRLYDGTTWTVLIVTSHGFPVGAIFPWSAWERYLAIAQPEWLSDAVKQRPEDARVLAIVPARNRLRDLPEQFAREISEYGESWPFTVTKFNLPVFTIIPCDMSEALVKRLLGTSTVQVDEEEDTIAQKRPLQEDASPSLLIVSHQHHKIIEMTRNGVGIERIAQGARDQDSPALRLLFWQALAEIAETQKVYVSSLASAGPETDPLPGFSFDKQNLTMRIRLVSQVACAVQIARCLVELDEQEEWRYLVAYAHKHAELNIALAVQGLLAMLVVCQIDPQAQQDIQEGHYERIGVSLVSLLSNDSKR